MLAVFLLEQIKPSLIVAARRHAVALHLLTRRALPLAGQRSTWGQRLRPQAAARDFVEVEKSRGAGVGEPPDGPRINHIARYREIAVRKSQLVPCLTSQLANYKSKCGLTAK